MSTSLEIGILGLPNVGKTTLFNALTKAGVETNNCLYSTVEPKPMPNSMPTNPVMSRATRAIISLGPQLDRSLWVVAP